MLHEENYLLHAVRVSGQLQQGPGQHGCTSLMTCQQYRLHLKAQLLLHTWAQLFPSVLHHPPCMPFSNTQGRLDKPDKLRFA